ncbi:MAG: TldD/PmbA family protein [Elusimicrobia bacterium]|nr:TldD/PmbA family protein [Elusimicrobiota bacterium]
MLAVLLAAALLPSSSRAQPPDPVLDALSAELRRSVKGLRMAEPGTPLYYLSYQAVETRARSLSAILGSLHEESEGVSRTLDVDARVGSRALDNTHQIKGAESAGHEDASAAGELPVDDEPRALRQAAWELTDRAFKEAQSRYTKAAADKAVTADEADDSADFSAEAPQRWSEPALPAPPDPGPWRDRLRRLSSGAARYPFLVGSNAALSLETRRRWFADSDGAALADGDAVVRLDVALTARTTGGMELDRSASWSEPSLDRLPPEEELAAVLTRLAEELGELVRAPDAVPYQGPAVFGSTAAAVLFHEILGHRLEGHRQKLESEGQTFAKKLGQPVTAEFLSVYDDPSLRALGGRALSGAYRFDDEGQPGRRAQLVKDGRLTGFLMSRAPIAAAPRSNGHGRRSSGRRAVARMANLVVEASRTVPAKDLRALLRAELKRQDKPWGLWFEDIEGGYTTTTRDANQAFEVQPKLVYRVWADGRPDEPVHGVDIVGTPLASFMKIVAAGDDLGVFNGVCGAESGWVPVSASAPSLLFSEIEVEKGRKDAERPPLLPAPHHDPRVKGLRP